MRIKVNGIQLDVGEALQQYVNDKLMPLAEKYFPDPIEATVNISKRNPFFHVDISIHAKRGLHLKSTFEADEVYAAFDQACAKMEQRLKRHKNKIRDHGKRAEAVEALKIKHLVINQTDYNAEEKEDEIKQHPTIVAEMPDHIDTMTVSEAVFRMDLGELPALLFKNPTHGELNMIYRRKDGNVGWVDPKNV